MEIQSVPAFLEYYGRIRQRTDKVVALIPAERIDWTCQEGCPILICSSAVRLPAE